jgi:hypothetical protein
MKIFKKLISVITAAVMSVSIFVIPSFAAEASLSVDTDPLPYYANVFNDSYTEIYKEIRTAIMNFEPSYTMSYNGNADRDFLVTAMDIAVIYDSYTFNLDKISAYSKGNKATLEFTYNMTEKTYKAGIAAADEAYAELEATFGTKDNTATKVKKIHDFIASRVVYDIEAPNSFNIIGVFQNGEAKCDGYASAFNYLAEKAGIESVFTAGFPAYKKDDIGHAWNKVKIGNSWYVIDITNNDQEDVLGYILYDYFMISDYEYSREYVAVDDKYVTEPDAINSSNSYYEQKRLTADTARDAIAMIQSQASRAKTTPILLEVQVTTDAEYKKLVTALSADTSLFSDYIKIPGVRLRSASISNTKMRTLHIAIREVD